MPTTTKAVLLRRIRNLIDEGICVVATRTMETHSAGMLILNPTATVDPQQFGKWLAGCRHLMSMLGPHARTWNNFFESDANDALHAETMQGVLSGIYDVVDQDLLSTIESLAFAEAFADLLEQAEHLHGNGYFLAAGVLGRAVLEEHLRKWCDTEKCSPGKLKPTLNDFTQALYAKKVIDKLKMKHVESMAAIGNECAHATGAATREDVDRLIRDVRAFVSQS